MNRKIQSVIFMMLYLLSGCDIMAVKSPEHIVQQWKVQVDDKSIKFLSCLNEPTKHLQFDCQIHYFVEDVTLFPDRYFYVKKEESGCIQADRRLDKAEAQCLSDLIQEIKFKALASLQKEERLEHQLIFKSIKQ